MSEPQEKKPIEQQVENKEGGGLGCSLGCIGIILIMIFGIASCVDKNNDSDYDSDCNTSWIEQDYNGDGEEDAEDFRIQTSACD